MCFLQQNFYNFWNKNLIKIEIWFDLIFWLKSVVIWRCNLRFDLWFGVNRQPVELFQKWLNMRPSLYVLHALQLLNTATTQRCSSPLQPRQYQRENKSVVSRCRMWQIACIWQLHALATAVTWSWSTMSNITRAQFRVQNVARNAAMSSFRSGR